MHDVIHEKIFAHDWSERGQIFMYAVRSSSLAQSAINITDDDNFIVILKESILEGAGTILKEDESIHQF